MKMKEQFCECADPGCPMCHGQCSEQATDIAYRIDMEDDTGTPLCPDCGDDATESGFFCFRAIRSRVPAAGREEEP